MGAFLTHTFKFLPKLLSLLINTVKLITCLSIIPYFTRTSISLLLTAPAKLSNFRPQSQLWRCKRLYFRLLYDTSWLSRRTSILYFKKLGTVRLHLIPMNSTTSSAGQRWRSTIQEYLIRDWNIRCLQRALPLKFIYLFISERRLSLTKPQANIPQECSSYPSSPHCVQSAEVNSGAMTEQCH